MNDKITCHLCGGLAHSIQVHLNKCHPEVSIEDYKKAFPDADLLSEAIKKKLIERKQLENATVAMVGTEATNLAEVVDISEAGVTKKFLHDVFKLGKKKDALSAKGAPIPVSVMTHADADVVPQKTDHYVYDIDELKNVLLALELNIPCYIWGHKGSGKSELLEQIAARTNRGFVRVQHTVNTEESHIVGQWTVRGGATIWEHGPLPIAMMKGYMYCADEYDFALPSVLSVYQAVLEGKPLMIKEADAANRIIRPHPHFRFVATGNTNGSGDETGLYQGTLIQNSANYDRFGVVIHKRYLPPDAETKILINHVGLTKEDAAALVKFATAVREAYDGAKISDVISPRTLINAARIGFKRGSFRQGLSLAFSNKLTQVDRELVEGYSQRIFGS